MTNTLARKNHRLPMLAPASVVVAMILGWAVAAQAQPAVHGTGTTNTIPVWTNSTTLGNSLMTQSGANVNVSGGVSASGAVSAPSFSGNGSGLSNVNAATLGGLGSSAFAQLGTANTFTANQAINGNLNLAGSLNHTLTLQGNLTDSDGDQGANVIGGFGGNLHVTANSVAKGVVGATIAGGGGYYFNNLGFVPNTVTANWGTVGGGALNTAGGTFSTIAGGLDNTVVTDGATVGGGIWNFAEAIGATVAGGFTNQANAGYSTVPGGYKNSADGEGSFAAGTNAIAVHDGSFVWNDISGGINSDTGPNQFVAKAAGGFTFYTAPGFPVGATLASGSGSWSSLSDRNVKSNFSAVDGQALLANLAALPIATWNYKAQPDSIRHMGPTAQDFSAAFGLGEDERHISTVDAQGVALAAIQALYKQVQELQEQVAQLGGNR